ncbi:unnamed protein product [Ceutorhynchus assimilis]|uniref:Uncharacterized protein n=1 Tax=Ceutorhynchus assimilis TaxID=467358 RepID=A0A9N9MM46_9CUCU|nr:unnamed protein product [Ceutorhynchus assimilis]
MAGHSYNNQLKSCWHPTSSSATFLSSFTGPSTPQRSKPAAVPSCPSCSCPPSTYCHLCRPINAPTHTGTSREGAYYWVDTFAHGATPSTAIHGGYDIDGTQIYVGRAFHEGDWLPAKVMPEKNVAYVAYNGQEHAKDRYQVLCEQRFDWVPSSGGHVPPGAVEGGRTSDGETLYVGRVHHEGSLTVGKVHPSHGACYIPFGGREIGNDSYEILVLRS